MEKGGENEEKGRWKKGKYTISEMITVEKVQKGNIKEKT